MPTSTSPSQSQSPRPQSPPRRKTVIAAGLLCGILAVLVTFTDRKAFFSPLSVVIVAAVGAAAVLLQLQFKNQEGKRKIHPPLWLNVVGVVFAVGALLSERLHWGIQTGQALALAAVASFAVSSGIILRAFRESDEK